RQGLNFLVREETANSGVLPVISNVRISNCHFENYKTNGIRLRRNKLASKFTMDILSPMQKDNKFDLPGKTSPVDAIRAKATNRISFNNVQIRNVGNTGLYIESAVNKVNISGLKIMYARLGVYID